MIKRACPIANWIKLEAQDYNEIQKRVNTDSQEKQKTCLLYTSDAADED